MAITYVGSASAAATSLTLPTHQAGDLLIFAAHSQGATVPSFPSGWIQRLSVNNTSRRTIVGFKTATSDAETSGTWTNAECVACAVYRSDASKYLSVSSARSQSAAATTTITYAAIINALNFSTWYYALCATDIDTTANTAPTGMVNRTSVVNTSELAIHDTNGNASWPSNQTVACSSTNKNTIVLELFETDIAITSGSGGGPLIGTGGLVY